MSCVTIPIVQKTWKLPSFLIYLIFHWTSSASPYLSSSTTISIVSFTQREEGFDWKTIDIYPHIIILIVQNFQKVVTKNHSFRFSKRRFSITTVLISFFGVIFSNLTLREKNRFEVQSSGFWINIRTLLGIESFFLTFVVIQSHFSLGRQVQFPPSKSLFKTLLL